jgi:hypothetical protein
MSLMIAIAINRQLTRAEGQSNIYNKINGLHSVSRMFMQFHVVSKRGTTRKGRLAPPASSATSPLPLIREGGGPRCRGVTATPGASAPRSTRSVYPSIRSAMSLFSTRRRNTIQWGRIAVRGSSLKSAEIMMEMMLEMMVGVNGRPRVGAACAGSAPFDGSRPRRGSRSGWRPQARKLQAVRRSAASV